MNKIIITLLLFTAFGSTAASAQSLFDDDEEELGIRLSISGELNSANAWRAEVGCHWFPCPYVGLGGSIGQWKQFAHDYVPCGQDWVINSDYRNASNFFIQPSVVLQSPMLVKTQNGGLSLFGQAGVMFNIPYERVGVDVYYNDYYISDYYDYTSSNRGRFCFPAFRLGLSFKIDAITISAGYSYSDLDVYAARRKMTYAHESFSSFYPSPKGTQGAFISLAVNM